MEVHAPHEPIHNWRDFVIHIVTITIGLLIALGLEAAVEAMHHRHIRVETRENLQEELRENQAAFPKDLHALDSETREMRENIALLQRLRAHQRIGSQERLHFEWFWGSPGDTAWQTARETGALALMDDFKVKAYDGVYSQQELVNQAALELTRDISKARVPLTIEPNLNALSPALIDELIRSCAANLSQIEYVQALASSVMPNYKEALEKL